MPRHLESTDVRPRARINRKPLPEPNWQPQPLSLLGWCLTLAAVLFLASSVVTQLLVEAVGADLRLEDTGDGDADTTALRIGLAVVLGRQLLFVGGIWLLHARLAANVPFPLSAAGWWPIERNVVFWAFGTYAAVIVYSALVSLFDVGGLVPESTVGDEITRDPVTLLLAGLLAVGVAPVSEEVLFRGVIFSALSRYGVLLAAFASGLLFALPHLDPGSILPFTLVGAALAWVYYRHRSLIAAIHFHVLFNAVSYVLLLLTA